MVYLLCSFLIELNMHLPDGPAVLLLDIYPSELKTYVHTKIGMQMCIAALFTIAKKVEITKMSFKP